MRTIKILLVDDHAVMRAGLAFLLNAEPDMLIIGEASNGFEAIKKLSEIQPDVVVMDLTMPGIDGLEATRRIKTKWPGVRVLVFTIHEERRYLHQLLQAGASGYFVKRAQPSDLVSAVRAVAHGQVAVYEPMLKHLAAQPFVVAPSETSDRRHELTDREKQVMDLLVHGLTNKEVAEQLFISRKTVEAHRANLFAKLHVDTRAALVRYAIQAGMFTEGPSSGPD